jgi:hypothetical protein
MPERYPSAARPSATREPRLENELAT